VAVNPSGTVLASAGADERIKLWDPRTGTEVATLERPRSVLSDYSCLAFADDKTLVSGTKLFGSETSGALRLWDVSTRQEIAALVHKVPNGFGALAVSPNGRLVAVAGVPSGFVSLWDLATRRERGRFRCEGGAMSLAFDPTGALLATGLGDRDNNLRLWDVDQLLEQQPAK
jgi:WD40 repeat protein